jgi:hypothetical protein
VISEQDPYAKGWEAGLEQARRILSIRMDRPEEALSKIHDLLIQAHVVKKGEPARKTAGGHW